MLPRGRGHHGRRLAVIVQADGLLTLSTAVICPTSTSAPAEGFHPEIRLDGGDPVRVLCEMIGAIDARNLGHQVAHLGHDELRAVDDAPQLVLGLH